MKFFLLSMITVSSLFFLGSTAWAVGGDDTSPGDACSNENAVRMTANPTGSGGYILTCEGGVWVATISGATPTANEHLATKAYVDAAAGGGGCVAPGDACADKTLFAVMYCSTDVVVGGSAACTPLYVAPRDQATSLVWKSTVGANDIATESTTDGSLNQAQVSPIASFPAFKVCDDFSYGGHTDWYLPTIKELTQVAPHHNALAFREGIGYWTSQETQDSPSPYYTDRANYIIYSAIGPASSLFNLKSYAFSVRCVRKD